MGKNIPGRGKNMYRVIDIGSGNHKQFSMAGLERSRVRALETS